jgi:FAD-dependent urate hydroxylase
MNATDVVVIGAGPNGLALAAHLDAAGVERRIFGTPMGAWRDHMPAGMLLKSEPYASDIAAPVPGFSAGDFCRSAEMPYRDRVTPLSRQRFIDYGDWFADQLVRDVERTSVDRVTKGRDGFRLATASGEQFSARRVVVATGIIPFSHVPAELASLPALLVSHSSDHSDLSRFRGNEVVVVGGGQSALETAALLHENGAHPQVIVRKPYVSFPTPNPETPGWKRRARHPVARLCEGWPCVAYQHFPDVFRSLPEKTRASRALGFLGPAGAWWLRPRVEGVVPLRIGTSVVAASRAGGRASLRLWGPAPDVVECDHVIAATGFRFDLARLAYLGPELRASIDVVAGAPVLSRTFESSVPGLYFMGALAAPSMGPAMRFVAGTHFAAPRVARALRQRRPRGRGTLHGPMPSSDRRPSSSTGASTSSGVTVMGVRVGV